MNPSIGVANQLDVSMQRRLLVALTLLCVALMLVFSLTGAGLTTNAAPYGIVSYELAFTAENAAAMLASWDADAQLSAAFGLGLDYLFMPAYAGALWLACGLAGQRLRRLAWPLDGWAGLLARGAVLAAVLDAIENAALWQQLISAPGDLLAILAGVCASIKFALIFLALVYALYAWAAGLAGLARSS